MSASLAFGSFVYYGAAKHPQLPQRIQQNHHQYQQQSVLCEMQKGLLDRYVTKDEKINFLAQETGMEIIMAEEYLASNCWNLDQAIKGYDGLMEHENKKIKEKENASDGGGPNLKKISRGFSMSNMSLVQQVREQLVVEQKELDEGMLENKLSLSGKWSFVLPDISQFGKVLAAFIKEDLISATAMSSLTLKGRLNWWTDIGACRKLYPLSTIGDGNCLLHAVSLAMWGFHDRMFRLRKALHMMLLSPNAKKSIKRRWKYNLWKENMKNGNLMYNRDEWDEEWEKVVKLASERPHSFDDNSKPRRITRSTLSRNNNNISSDLLLEGETLDSLEAIHVYVLSNLLHRPIIVISEDMLKDSSGRDIAPIPFGGIYLPLEQLPESCCKYPLVLSYNASHFSALVPIEGDATHNGERLSSSVPLMDNTLTMLPIQFLIDPGSTWDLVQDDGVKEEQAELTYEEHIILLRTYLDAVKVTFNNGNIGKNNQVGNQVHSAFVGQNLNVLISARLNMKDRPDNYTEMIENYITNARQRLKKLKISNIKCSTSTCNMFSTPDFNGYCLVCHEKLMYSPKSVPTAVSYTPESKCIRNVNSSCTNDNVMVHLGEEERTPLPCDTSTFNPEHIYENIFDITDHNNSGTEDFSSARHCYQNVGVRCQAIGCKFYGSLETNGYCSSCYRKNTLII